MKKSRKKEKKRYLVNSSGNLVAWLNPHTHSKKHPQISVATINVIA
jgi:hypothetical protein